MTTRINSDGSGDVFLNPGDLVFHCPSPGKPQPARLHTLLGSCVSVILWHPTLRLAGMSHAVLPSNGHHKKGLEFDGRYCDQVVDFFCQELACTGTRPSQFKVYLVGGGQMYLNKKDRLSIGERNLTAIRAHLKQAGFILSAEHVGLDAHRKVAIQLSSGLVTVTFDNRHIQLSGP